MQAVFQLLSMKCWKSHLFPEIYLIFYLLAVFFFNIWWEKNAIYSLQQSIISWAVTAC